MYNNIFIKNDSNKMAKTQTIRFAWIGTLILGACFATISISWNTTTAKQMTLMPTANEMFSGPLVDYSTMNTIPNFSDEYSPIENNENLSGSSKLISSEEPQSTKDLITKKLEEFARLQTSISTLEQLDSIDGTWEALISAQEAAKKASSLGQDIDTVLTDFEQIQTLRKENEERYTIVLNQVKKVIIDIKITRQAVSNTVLKINLYSRHMIDTISELQKTRERINNTKTTLIQLLPTVYMLQNEYTNQDGSMDDLKLLLGSWSLGENLSQEDMLAGLSVRLDTLLADLSTEQTQYIKNISTLRETRKQLKAIVGTYHEKIQTLEEQKTYLLYFVELYKNNKTTLDQTITDLFATRTDLERKMNGLIMNVTKNATGIVLSDGSGNQKEYKWYTINDPTYKEFLQLEDKREERVNFFGWPILPVNQINTYFGDTIDVGNTKEIFSGIQATATQWQEIYAPANGYVYFVQNQDWLNTNRMIILHNDGYISVFTNIQKSLVAEKSIVKRWQIIALIGGQPWTRWAWWFSTQPMVSMQIFKDWKAIDPLEVLDLSIFNDSLNLNSKYRTKFSLDTKLRNSVINLQDIKFVEWNTAQEKRLRFLNDYAKAPYNDIVLWEKAAEGTNIDPDLWICIGYAETSLGRAFASANNIGNVWNNDRGDRVDKESPLVGAHAIYTTLNNGYLGGYNTIFELSGYGNKEGAIYASSEYNWQKNVSRCLSTIKWYVVPEDYPFRTYHEN